MAAAKRCQFRRKKERKKDSRLTACTARSSQASRQRCTAQLPKLGRCNEYQKDKSETRVPMHHRLPPRATECVHDAPTRLRVRHKHIALSRYRYRSEKNPHLGFLLKAEYLSSPFYLRLFKHPSPFRHTLATHRTHVTTRASPAKIEQIRYHSRTTDVPPAGPSHWESARESSYKEGAYLEDSAI